MRYDEVLSVLVTVFFLSLKSPKETQRQLTRWKCPWRQRVSSVPAPMPVGTTLSTVSLLQVWWNPPLAAPSVIRNHQPPVPPPSWLQEAPLSRVARPLWAKPQSPRASPSNPSRVEVDAKTAWTPAAPNRVSLRPTLAVAFNIVVCRGLQNPVLWVWPGDLPLALLVAASMPVSSLLNPCQLCPTPCPPEVKKEAAWKQLVARAPQDPSTKRIVRRRRKGPRPKRTWRSAVWRQRTRARAVERL